MKVVKLFLPGRFEDAFLYMGRLVVLTENQTLRFYNLETIIESLEAKYPDLMPIPTLMFVRNDWLATAQFESMINNSEVAAAIGRTFERFPQPHIILEGPTLRTADQELRVSAQVFLDMLIYGGRLYLGADSGFYHFDIDWDSDNALNHDVKRLDARCLNVSARFGAINASCGNDGLFTTLDEFATYSAADLGTTQRTAKRSLRSSWLRYNLVNYSNVVSPTVLWGHLETADRDGPAREKRVITRLGHERLSLDYLFDTIREQYTVDPSSIQYTYNAENIVFIYTTDGQFYSLTMSNGRESYQRPKIKLVRTYKGATTRLISAHEIKGGLVIEAYDRVVLFHEGEWPTEPIVDSEVLSVRTFPRSRRYQNIAAITLDDGLVLVGVFDDSVLGIGPQLEVM